MINDNLVVSSIIYNLSFFEKSQMEVGGQSTQ